MTNRRIVILGFMGCGKTTVAAELGRELNCSFIDLDSYILERQGRSSAEIIQYDSETTFREIETLALRDVLQQRGAHVVALGGGTWTIPANRTLIALHDCLSVWLDAPFELFDRDQAFDAEVPGELPEAALVRVTKRAKNKPWQHRSIGQGGLFS